MAKIKLKKCPFCGGEAELVTNHHVYLDDARVVRCLHCHCRTASVLVNHPKMVGGGKLDESTRYTAEQAEIRVAELWNNRATAYQ